MGQFSARNAFLGLGGLGAVLAAFWICRGNGAERVVESSYTPEAREAVPAPKGRPLVPPTTWGQPPPLPSRTGDFPSEAQLYQRAAAITVRVLSGPSSGSGILVRQQGQLYTVVTNEHVLIFGRQDRSYRLQTPDGQVHPAQVGKAVNFQGRDLALLEFRSDRSYQVAALSSSVSLARGEEVFAAGFPSEAAATGERGLTFSKGRVQMWSQQAFGGGYQVGYTISLKKGMSGGPLLNRQGQVVGINGVHKYPLWGNPYVFADGSVASAQEKEQMQQLSWAIPLPTFLQFFGGF